MKTTTSILFSLLFLLSIACKKEKHYPDKILIGNTSANDFIYYDVNPDTILRSVYHTTTYKIDTNQDQVDDFEFILLNDFIKGGTVLNHGTLSIGTLSDNAYVFSDSSMNANVLSYGDTLKNSGNFRNGQFLLCSAGCNPLSPFYDCSSIGKWAYIDKKYIGVRLKNDRLGWIKVGVIEATGIWLEVYDYGIIKD